jgi:hypothetical protein
MEVTTIGIDWAKNVFAVCGADSSERVLMRWQLGARRYSASCMGRRAAWWE